MSTVLQVTHMMRSCCTNKSLRKRCDTRQHLTVVDICCSVASTCGFKMAADNEAEVEWPHTIQMYAAKASINKLLL